MVLILFLSFFLDVTKLLFGILANVFSARFAGVERK